MSKANPVLIIGNGVSRRAYLDQIESWPGERWATNWAFLEFPELLSRITGHTEVMVRAHELREANGWPFEIWMGHCGRSYPFAQRFDCGPKWLRDSGTTLVAQALHEGRDVTVVGFDLGGPDIHSPNLWRSDKRNWITRWAEIFGTYGRDCVKWIGHDHSEFIEQVRLGQRNANEYAKSYSRRKPHIDRPEYKKAWSEYMAEVKVTTRGAARAEKKVKVLWNNGFKTEIKEHLALIYQKKGQLQILGAAAEAPQTPQPETPPESQEVADAPGEERKGRRARS